MPPPRLVLAIISWAAFLQAQQPRPPAAGGASGMRRGDPSGPQQQPQPGQPRQPQQQRQAPKEYRAEELATVEGYVRNGVTGEVLAKATVTLMGTGRQRQPYAASTDASGKFAITGIEPGQYRVTVQRNGYVGSELSGSLALSPGSTLSLATSQTLKGFEAKLTPHGVVTGHVYDTDGEPVARASVQLMRYRYTQQGQRELSTTNVAQTNDLGEYRAYGVPPGKYFLGVVMVGGGLGPFGRGFQANGENPVPTFYPGTAEPSQATVIDISVGGTVQGIDVRLLTARTFVVSGEVVGGSVGRRGGSVMLIPESRGSTTGTLPPIMRSGLNGSVRPDGKFVVRGVPAGSYSIILDSFENDTRQRGTGEVTVGERNVENAQVRLHPSFEVPVTVRLDGQGTADFSNVIVNLAPREAAGRRGTSNAIRVESDGTATLPQVFPGHYDVLVNGLPAGLFVKAMRAGEAEAFADGAHLQPGTRLDILVSSASASVAGSITNEKGEPIASGSVILMAPNAPLLYRLRTAAVDQQGRFNFSGVAPGEYLLAALEESDAGVYWEPSFLLRNDKLIEKLVVRENATENKTLKLIAGSGQ